MSGMTSEVRRSWVRWAALGSTAWLVAVGLITAVIAWRISSAIPAGTVRDQQIEQLAVWCGRGFGFGIVLIWVLAWRFLRRTESRG